MDSSKYKAKYLLTYLLVDNQHIVHTYTVSQKSSRRTVVHNFAQSLNTDLFSNLFTCTISRKFAIKSCENNRQPCGSRSIINGRGVDPYGTGGTRPPQYLDRGGHDHECPPQYFWSNISYFLSMQCFLDKLKEFLVF